MSILHFAQFNNYASRELKGVGNSLEDYNVQFSISGVNFNVRDGIATFHTVNDKNKVLDGVNFPFNYCIVTDDIGNITSRWFVMESDWNCKHQWNIQLLRDVLVDYDDTYQTTPFYCDKGMVDSNDVLVYNAEPYKFNQVLTKRGLLRKESGQANRYIIGYVDKTWPGAKIKYAKDVVEHFSEETNPFRNYTRTIGNTKQYGSKTYGKAYGYAVHFAAAKDDYSLLLTTSNWVNLKCVYLPGRGISPVSAVEGSDSIYRHLGRVDLTTGQAYSYGEYIYQNMPDLFTDVRDIASQKGFISNGELDYLNGKRVAIGGTVYDVEITYPSASLTPKVLPYNEGLIDTFAQAWQSAASGNYVGQFGTQQTAHNITVYYYSDDANIVLTPVENITEIDMTGTREGLDSLPYDIFVMDDTEPAREFASYFASQFAGGNVLYDLQLFPFSPPKGDPITLNDGHGTKLYWATSDSSHGTLYHDYIKTYSSAAAKKRGSVQDTIRLIAPNGSACWEFNPAQIGGVPANSIKYEFTLMPFNPYLHIFPEFGGIYGNVNKSYTEPMMAETRGLICGGSYSFPYSSDKWATYQLQNSAYRDSFNRQIENMSVTQAAQRVSDIVQIGAGVLQGAGTGAIMGGGVGAVAGGIGSALTGVIGGAMNEMMRQEQLDYAKDQFEYSLQNIKAQAQPLAHSSSITIGNSYFPMFELYEATTQEQNILDELLRVHGYTVGKVTTFADCKNKANATSRYVRGRLINFQMEDDAHIANQITKELAEGVYIEL